MTDVVGILEACDDDHVEVRRRDGSLRRVARADIVALKVVSTPPPRPRGPADDPGDSG
jgi:hypothetical protein